MPVLVLLCYIMMGKDKLILGANSFDDRRNATAETNCLSPAEGGNFSDCFSLFQSKLCWRPKDTSRESQVARESDALGWSSAAEQSWAPGKHGAHDNQEALQRDSCAQEQLLCKAKQG